jgi:hypothetical protein
MCTKCTTVQNGGLVSYICMVAVLNEVAMNRTSNHYDSDGKLTI